MEDRPCIYTLYFFREADGDRDRENRAGIYINRKNGSTGLDEKNLDSLSRYFVRLGWRITNTDIVQTITPLITNEWSPTPWSPTGGISTLVPKGKLIQYSGLSGEQLREFYNAYRCEVASLSGK